jgi:hypothetical protein
MSCPRSHECQDCHGIMLCPSRLRDARCLPTTAEAVDRALSTEVQDGKNAAGKFAATIIRVRAFAEQADCPLYGGESHLAVTS